MRTLTEVRRTPCGHGDHSGLASKARAGAVVRHHHVNVRRPHGRIDHRCHCWRRHSRYHHRPSTMFDIVPPATRFFLSGALLGKKAALGIPLGEIL